MRDDPGAEEQLDRLARAVPGWLARKLLHGIGWLIAGLWGLDRQPGRQARLGTQSRPRGRREPRSGRRTERK
jgi:hypothetical protein